MRLFRKDFLRGVTGWMFYLAVLLGLACCLRSMFYVMFSFELVPVGTLNLFFGTVVFNEGGYLLIVAPLIAALPFSMAYLDDVRSGFLKCEILRMRPASYAFQRALSTAVLGGLVFVVIMGIYLLICLFVDPRASLRGAAPYDFVFKSTYAYTMKGALGLYLLQCFEYGACYALFAMGLSALIPVKIIAFLIPVIFHQYIHMLGWILPIGEAMYFFGIAPSATFSATQGDLLKMTLGNAFVGVVGVVLYAIGFARWRRGNWMV